MPTPLIPKHPDSGCFADWFLGDGECFECSDWIMITIGAWLGRRWFEGDKDQIQTIQAHITYGFTSWKRIRNIRCLYKPVCVRTEDLDKAGAHLLDKVIAEVIGTFDGVEEISVELRESIVNEIQGKDILAVLPTSYGKSKCCLFQWIFGLAGRLCSGGFYVCALFSVLVSYWEVMALTLIFYGLFLVGMICHLMQ